MENALILAIILVFMDRKDALSIVVVLYYLACLALYITSSLIYLDSNLWHFSNAFIDIVIIWLCIFCYYKQRNTITIIYIAALVVIYLIPNIIQFYGFELNNYEEFTTFACLIDIIIVGRRYVKRIFTYYNGGNKCDRASGSNHNRH